MKITQEILEAVLSNIVKINNKFYLILEDQDYEDLPQKDLANSCKELVFRGAADFVVLSNYHYQVIKTTAKILEQSKKQKGKTKNEKI